MLTNASSNDVKVWDRAKLTCFVLEIKQVKTIQRILMHFCRQCFVLCDYRADSVFKL